MRTLQVKSLKINDIQKAQIQILLKEHPSDSMETIAKASGYSERTLFRLLKKHKITRTKTL